MNHIKVKIFITRKYQGKYNYTVRQNNTNKTQINSRIERCHPPTIPTPD